MTCSCRAKDYARSGRTDTEGRFRLTGIPINSECYLEVVRHDGIVMVRSNSFETVQRKEIHQDLIVPVESLETREEDQSRQQKVANWDEEDSEEEQSSRATSVGV